MEDQESERAEGCEGKRVVAGERVMVVADRAVVVSTEIEELLSQLEAKTQWLT